MSEFEKHHHTSMLDEDISDYMAGSFSEYFDQAAAQDKNETVVVANHCDHKCKDCFECLEKGHLKSKESAVKDFQEAFDGFTKYDDINNCKRKLKNKKSYFKKGKLTLANLTTNYAEPFFKTGDIKFYARKSTKFKNTVKITAETKCQFKFQIVFQKVDFQYSTKFSTDEVSLRMPDYLINLKPNAWDFKVRIDQV